MKNPFEVLGGLTVAAVLMCTSSAQAAFTYSGNQSESFGGQIGNQVLTVSDSASTGLVTFSFTSGGINDVAFYFSTGSPGVSNTSLITDTTSENTRTISGAGTNGDQSLVTFASGFSAGYAVAIGGDTGDGNLYSINSTTGVLTLITSVNEVRSGTSSTTTGYSFSLNATSIGLKAGSGASFGFVASDGNANDGNTTNYFRSNEAFGSSNYDNEGTTGPQPGNTGTIAFSGFDTFTLSVPEPATWAIMLGGLGTLAGVTFRRRRI